MVETRKCFKKRTGVDFSTSFINEKVFHGSAARRLADDIRAKQASEYIKLQHTIVGAALIRSKRYLAEMKMESMLEGDFCKTCYEEIEDEVKTTFLELVDGGSLYAQASQRSTFEIGYRRDINEMYFIINSVTNEVRLGYELLRKRYARRHPIINIVCEEILALDVWHPHPKRSAHPDRRWGWTFCHPGMKEGAIIETFTTTPGDLNLKVEGYLDLD